MEILKRAQSDSDGEIISPFTKEEDLRDEVNARTAKAGYTTRLGEPTYRQKISAGWTRRYEDNYQKIFGKE